MAFPSPSELLLYMWVGHSLCTLQAMWLFWKLTYLICLFSSFENIFPIFLIVHLFFALSKNPLEAQLHVSLKTKTVECVPISLFKSCSSDQELLPFLNLMKILQSRGLFFSHPHQIITVKDAKEVSKSAMNIWQFALIVPVTLCWEGIFKFS